MWPWSELGLPGPTELEAVKAAYGQRLRELHPEEDPEGFQRLYRAYQAARQLAAEQAFPPAGAKAEPGAADCPHSQGATDWDFEQLLSQGERDLALTIGALCGDAELNWKGKNPVCTGDPTEAALVEAAARAIRRKTISPSRR